MRLSFLAVIHWMKLQNSPTLTTTSLSPFRCFFSCTNSSLLGRLDIPGSQVLRPRRHAIRNLAFTMVAATSLIIPMSKSMAQWHGNHNHQWQCCCIDHHRKRTSLLYFSFEIVSNCSSHQSVESNVGISEWRWLILVKIFIPRPENNRFWNCLLVANSIVWEKELSCEMGRPYKKKRMERTHRRKSRAAVRVYE